MLKEVSTIRRHSALKTAERYVFLFAGAVIAAAGLEFFLLPNSIIDGGVIGVSIMASHLTGIPLGVFTLALNLPFVVVGHKQIGKTFVASYLFSVLAFSVWVSVFHPIPGLTDDNLLAAVFGGVILGIGVGLIIRFGGSLDGTEIVAIVFSRRLPFSIGQIIMFFNVFILGSAGFVFGWNRAMYSLIAYFTAYKLIDVVVEGINEAKAAIIITDRGEEISSAIAERLGRGVTVFEGRGGFSQNRKTIIYSVITRLELPKLKSIVSEIDGDAFVTISDVSDIIGGRHNKRNIH